MKLRDLMKIIVDSDPSHWHKIGCWGAGSGPSFKDRIEFSTGPGDHWNLETPSHSEVAVYKPDVSITMAWGFEANDDYVAEWTKKFSDEKARSFLVDVFYNNALVFREYLVSVDGARAYLPMPDGVDTLTVPVAYNSFVQLIESLSTRSSEYSGYFDRAGFTAVDTPWPEDI